MIDDRTTNYNLPLPAAGNRLQDDVDRLRTATTNIDGLIFWATERLMSDDQSLDHLQDVVNYAKALNTELLALTTDLGIVAANLDAYTDRADEITVTYDGSGRVDTVTETYGSETRTLAYAYDVDGLVSSVVETWGGIERTETFGYDGSGRLSTVTTAEQEVP